VEVAEGLDQFGSVVISELSKYDTAISLHFECLGGVSMQPRLISKLLRNHQAANAAVQDADANAGEILVQNVRAMTG
jgi:hypothetical protein